jgi:hypothetical protein
MDDRAFDNLARRLGGAGSRRQVVRRLGAGLAGALAGTIGVQRAARAQGCITPDDCEPLECHATICDAACSCCTYAQLDDGTSCDGGICCGGVCRPNGQCCATGDCSPETCQTVSCDTDEHICRYSNQRTGTACSTGGCCENGVCNKNKKPCGSECINQDACCTSSRPGCLPPACQTATCTSGTCTYQNASDGSGCEFGTCCGGACTTCPSGGQCTGTSCVCPSGQQTCGGACTNVTTDEANCGRCGNQCADGSICAVCRGDCDGKAVAKCCPSTRRTNCSGVCVNTKTDEANCGGCGKRCRSNQVCRQGDCV